MKKPILLCLPLMFTACTPFPVSQETTAHTLGTGIWGTSIGASEAETVYLRQSYGVTPNDDVGLVVEGQPHGGVAGITAKHAFINQERGYSFAVDGSVGYSFFKFSDDLFDEHSRFKAMGPYFSMGPILSYRTEYVDTFGSIHANYFHISNHDHANDQDNTDIHNVLGTATIGSTLWFTKHVGLMGSANLLFDDKNAQPYLTAGLTFKY